MSSPDRHLLPGRSSRLYETEADVGRPSSSRSGEANAVRMNALNSSMQEAREARSNRTVLIVVTMLYIPQIIASIIVMGLFWTDAANCFRLKLWLAGQATFLSLSLAVEWVLYAIDHQTCFSEAVRTRIGPHARNFNFALELIGLFWFLVGNLWIINENPCSGSGGSAFHTMAMVLLVISYVKIFLPCVIILLLLPVACFCLPCLVRMLQNMADPMRGKGASQDLINQIRTVKYSKGAFPNDDDGQCCICLNAFEDEEETRVLPCEHHYHKDCVDAWLLVNATCPTCREPIRQDEQV